MSRRVAAALVLAAALVPTAALLRAAGLSAGRNVERNVGRNFSSAKQLTPPLVGRNFSSAKMPPAAPQDPGVAFFIRDLTNPRDRREARPDVLDTPVNPGSVVKAVALAAAIESGVLGATEARVCRRVATVDNRRYVCSHPDLKRPLTPAEALAHSCNDFFVSLAQRLSREALNRVRLSSGLPPIGASVPMAAAIVGLDGPRTTPRALVDVVARLAGAGSDPPAAMGEVTRAIVLEGLKGAATYGTAAAFKQRGISALAKTGTITMPGGGALGLVVALEPADRPARAIVVVAPGGAGADAADVAATLLALPRAVAAVPPVAAEAAIRLGRTDRDGRTRVERVPIETYVAQVLAGEGQPRAGDAAQQALAIAARTFALANANRHRREGFDLCDTTHCQVVRPATAVTTRAARATAGRVLVQQGRPALVFYSAWCGGRSELPSQVWPGAEDTAYAAARADDACADEPAWTSEIRVGEIERALRAAGLKGARLRDLEVVSRNASERVARVRLDGFVPAEMSGHEFRMAIGRGVGWQVLKSTAFDVVRTGTGYRFRGRGYGHGVGLCVVGAGRRAARGASAAEILRFYFPGLTLGDAGATDVGVAAAPAPETPAAAVEPAPAAGPAAPDVLLSLPAAEESERAALVALVRRARSDVAKATGVAPPARLKVTVHPTVESFGRATGQPWWASGATEGTTIELLPVAVLRQQGQLERTVTHEVAHALLDQTLAGRPMWVREGAAAYFANPRPTATARPARAPCPTDIELLRPVSAGAERDAYARAEACFARAMAEGKRWDKVR